MYRTYARCKIIKVASCSDLQGSVLRCNLQSGLLGVVAGLDVYQSAGSTLFVGTDQAASWTGV